MGKSVPKYYGKLLATIPGLAGQNDSFWNEKITELTTYLPLPVRFDSVLDSRSAEARVSKGLLLDTVRGSIPGTDCGQPVSN